MAKTKIIFLFPLLILVLLLKATPVKANHVWGETVTYNHLGGNQYVVDFTFYIDCNFFGSFNTFAYNIQSATTGNIITDTAKIQSNITTDINLCGTSLCVKKTVYSDTITLGDEPAGYHIWANSCCRNNNLVNVKTSGFGIENFYTFYTFIPGREFNNSSPAIIKDPLQIICLNKKLTFNAGFYDKDGDSLVFKLVQPYNFSADSPNFVPSAYNSGYSFIRPFGLGSPVVTIDSATGVITAEARQLGNYLIAVEVHEYRFDPISGTTVYLGKVMIELVFIAINCGTNRAPTFNNDPNGQTKIINAGEKFCFNISGKDSVIFNSRYDILTLNAYSSAFGKSGNFPAPYASFNGDTNSAFVTSEFCWTPSCDHISYSSPHLVTFVLEDDYCNVVEKTYSIYVRPKIHTPVLQCLDVTAENEIKLNYKLPPNDSTFFAYHIYRKKLPTETEFTKIATIKEGNFSSWTDVNAYFAKDTFYQYFITSENNCGIEMRASDTLQTIRTFSRDLPTGNTEFSWNPAHPIHKDSFVVSIDTGQGMQPYDTISGKAYVFQLCGRNLKLQIAQFNANGTCFSRSAISDTYYILDTFPPSVPVLQYVTVKNHSTIEVAYFKPKDFDVKHCHIYCKKNNENFKFLTTQSSADTGLITFTHTGITAGTDTFSYYIVAIGSCPENVSLPSDTNTALQLKGNPGNNSNSLNWNTYKGFDVEQYIVELWHENKWVTFDSTNSLTTTFIHDSLPCKQIKYYRIKAVSTAYPNLISISDSIALTPFDTIKPNAPQLFVASVENTGTSNGIISILLKGQRENDRMGYNIYRSENTSIFSLIKTITDTTAANYYKEDSTRNTTDKTYAYFITAFDSCGNESIASDTHHLVHLKAKPHSGYIALNWNHYKGFSKWHYLIEKRNINVSPIWSAIANLNATETTLNDSNVRCFIQYEYRIKTMDENSNWYSLSNIATEIAFEENPPIAAQIKNVSVTQSGNTNGEVLIEWNASVSDDIAAYHLYKSTDGNNWQTAATNIPSNKLSHLEPGLNTLQNSYHFRLNSIDSCGNISESFSETHKTILLKAVAGNQEVNLNWNAYKGWKIKEYQLTRNGVAYAKFADTVLHFKDTNVFCKQTYNYLITAIADSSFALNSNSNIASANPYDNKAPDAVYISSVSVSQPNKETELKWNASTAFDAAHYLVYKRISTTNELLLLDSTTNLFFTDHFADEIISPDCYFVAVKDQCGNISQLSNKACIIILKTTNKEGYNQLDWNNYQHWDFGVRNYNIYKKEDSLPWKQIGSVPGIENTFSDRELTDNILNYCYQIEAVENTGQQQTALSRSTVSCAKQEAVFYMPNSFTPHNPDDLNPIFGPVGMYIKNYSMQVYNRWGEVVYNTTSGKGWDGKINGSKAPDGVYFYMIKVEGNTPGEKFFKGNVTLLW